MKLTQHLSVLKRLIALLAATIAGAACSAVPALTPTLPPTSSIDLLSDSTCNKPCVLGITPGNTTQPEAWKIVENNKLLSSCTQEDLTSQGGIRWIECTSNYSGITSLHISFSHDMAYSIAISPQRLTVEQLVQRYGAPDYLQASIGSRPEDPWRSKGILAYNDIRAIVTLIEQPTRTYNVTPDGRVETITFWNEDEYASLRADILHAWSGYGVYSP